MPPAGEGVGPQGVPGTQGEKEAPKVTEGEGQEKATDGEQAETETVTESETVIQIEPVVETQTTRETLEADQLTESQPIIETNPELETQPTTEIESTIKIQPETNHPDETEKLKDVKNSPLIETKQLIETQTHQVIETKQQEIKAESVPETQPVIDSQKIGETQPVIETQKVIETSQVIDTEQVIETIEVIETSSMNETEASKVNLALIEAKTDASLTGKEEAESADKEKCEATVTKIATVTEESANNVEVVEKVEDSSPTEISKSISESLSLEVKELSMEDSEKATTEEVHQDDSIVESSVDNKEPEIKTAIIDEGNLNVEEKMTEKETPALTTENIVNKIETQLTTEATGSKLEDEADQTKKQGGAATENNTLEQKIVLEAHTEEVIAPKVEIVTENKAKDLETEPEKSKVGETEAIKEEQKNGEEEKVTKETEVEVKHKDSSTADDQVVPEKENTANEVHSEPVPKEILKDESREHASVAVETQADNEPEATSANHDYEDVTPIIIITDKTISDPEPSVEKTAKDIIENIPETDIAPTKNNRDSFIETKEEIVDNLEFIKAKLSTPPIAPVKTKRASKEIKDTENEEKAKEVKPTETIVILETDLKEAEIPKSTDSGTNQNGSGKENVEEFSVECIPPVRPARSRKQKLSVPEWKPPRQSILEYVFPCLRPNISD